MTMTETRYFERMNSALGDKARMLDFLPPVTAEYAPSVLDIGAGGGALTGELLRLGYRVTAVDSNVATRRQLREDYPEAHPALLFAHEVYVLGTKFDAVLCSSVLHEVYSYRDAAGMHGMMAVAQSIQAFHKVLKPGGVLVVRDGVKPDDADKKGFVVIRGEVPNDFPVYEYLRQVPFREIWLNRTRPGFFHGNYQSLMEFVFTYNWGVETYHREAKELYGIMKLDEYAAFVERAGFECFSREAYVQQGYVDALEPKVKLLDIKYKPLPMFNTNAIWAYRKK